MAHRTGGASALLIIATRAFEICRRKSAKPAVAATLSAHFVLLLRSLV